MRTASFVENAVTLIVCGATLVGLYAFGASGWSFLALLMLLNLNRPKPPGSG